MFNRPIASAYSFIRRFFKENPGYALFYALLVFMAYLFIFRYTVVWTHTVSMTPTFVPGDLMLLSRHDKDLMRGDVTVFDVEGFDEPFTKRVIGVGGDTVRLTASGEIFVNDILIEEPYLAVPAASSDQYFEVPLHHYFVLGDYRIDSLDSRSLQDPFISQEAIIGTGRLIYWPPSRWTLF